MTTKQCVNQMGLVVAVLSCLRTNSKLTYNHLKTILRCLLAALALMFVGQSAGGAFSSMYVFADSLSSTTNNVNGGTNYFGTRWCNGPVWVEYLARQQGIAYQDTNNTSGFGFNTAYLTNFVGAFPAKPDATNSLFVVWAGVSDLFWAWVYNNTNDLPWADSINQNMTNTAWIIQNLYSKGARSLVLPTAVDIGAAPAFSALPPESKAYLHQKAIQYNTALSNLVSQSRVTLPALTIYSPDLFSEFESLLANPAAYGFATTNIDALEDIAIADKSTNGPGANHIFWDTIHPTTKVQNLMAQQVYLFMSPRFSNLIHTGTNSRLDLANLPIGATFMLETSTNLVIWQTTLSLTATSALQTVNLQTNANRLFFRLKF